MSAFKGLPSASVALSLLLARSAGAQVAAEPEVQPQVEPASGGASSIVQVPPEAPAEPPPPTLTAAPPLAPSNERLPFFLAAALGVGELWIKNAETQTWGQTVPFEISGGVAFTPKVALLAEGYVARIVFPVSDLAKTNKLDLRSGGLGVRLTLPGPDISLTGSLSIARLHVDYSSWNDETSLWGILARLSVGRQWIVSRYWSLGLAGELTYGRMAWGGEPLPPVPGPYLARGFALLFSGAFGATSAAGTVAGEPASGGRVHAHDGFFLNTSVGLGKLWLTDGDLYGRDISGTARSLELSAGYAITPSLVLFGAFWEVFAPNPDFYSDPLADLELHGAGPGVRYYLSSLGVFLDGALLVSRVGFHNTFPGDGRYGINATSDWRPVARAAIGWESWVSAGWGLGAAAEALVGRMPSRDRSTEVSGPSYTVKGLSLLLSATFN